MEITKEEFGKLNQLDRIEYRQKLDRILEIPSFASTIFYGFLYMAFLCLFMMVTNIHFWILNSLWVYSMNYALIVMLGGGIFIFVLGMVGEFFRNKRIKELEEEYFGVKLKDAKEKTRKN